MPTAAIAGRLADAMEVSTQPGATSARAAWSAAGSEARSGVLFVAPYLIVFTVLLIYPLISGIWLSLHKADLFGGSQFIGLENYARLFRDAVFLKAVRNTLYFVLLTVPPLTLIGLGLALALNNRSRASTLLRGLFFSSSVLSVTIVTLIWRMVLIPDGGLIANVLTRFGLSPIPFLSDATGAEGTVRGGRPR
jgi:multiple sugar transport system permease protein